MSHRIGLLFTTTLLLTSTSALSAEVDDYDRFRLWNECRPMQLVVEDYGNDAGAGTIDLANSALEVAMRSRLRAARLYTENNKEAGWSYLYINVNVVGRAFHTRTSYRKVVRDDATGLEYNTITWDLGFTGTHGGDSGFVLSSLSQHADEFIDEYLRVNADACE